MTTAINSEIIQRGEHGAASRDSTGNREQTATIIITQNVYHSFNFKLRKYKRLILRRIARFLSPFTFFVLGGVQKR